MKRTLLNRLIFSSGLLLASGVLAAPVVDVLERAALPVAHVERSVLLGVSAHANKVIAVGERGLIARSDDGGVTWKQAAVPVSVTLTAVQMIDRDVGYAVGHSGVVLKTADGGATWQKLLDGRQLAVLSLDAAKAAGDAAAIARAERLVADGADKPLLALHFTDRLHGMVLGSYNLAFSTSDGGKTWASIAHRFDNPKGLHLSALSAQGQQLLVTGEQGLVFVSDDAGQTFKRLKVPYEGSFFTAQIVGVNEFVVAGLRGNVWRTADHGNSWAQIDVPSPVSFVASASGRTSGPLLANQAGQIFALEGSRLKPLPAPARAPLNAIIALDADKLVVLAGSGAAVLGTSVAGGQK